MIDLHNRHVVILLLLISSSSGFSYAQEMVDHVLISKYGKSYIDINIRSLERYNRRLEGQQRRLLKKLNGKERKLETSVQAGDSATCERYYAQDAPSYDSISRIAGKKLPDNPKEHHAYSGVDSLKRVLQFTHPDGSLEKQAYEDRLETLGRDLGRREHVSELIRKRERSLRKVAPTSDGKIPGLKAIEKQVYYGREKVKVIKQISEESSRAEEEALEYLQGTEGFDRAMQPSSGALPVMGGRSMMTATDMSAAGIQTKQQVNSILSKQLGPGNISKVQEHVGKQLQDWQKKYNESAGHAKGARNNIQQLRSVDKPSFRVNPMRGLPFWQRIEKQFTLNTFRASSERPARLETGAMTGFKHTPRFSYGVGLAGSLGLGQGWQQIRFSLEGIGVRTYAAWQWQYGIGAYAGYERMHGRTAFLERVSPVPDASRIQSGVSTTHLYTESILLGLTKSYKINNKWNGVVQLLYDVWWRENGLRSPLVFRLNYNK